jgi:hypothetical protein
MPETSHLTIGDIAEFFGEPDWKIRRIVDALPDDIPRAGRYRLIPRDLLPKIGVILERKSNRETAACS